MFILSLLEIIVSFCLDYFIFTYLLEYKVKRKFLLIILSVIFLFYLLFSLKNSNENIVSLVSVPIQIIICIVLKVSIHDIKAGTVFKTHIVIYAINILIASIIMFLSNRLFNDNEIKLISFITNLCFSLFIVIICKVKISSIRKIFFETTTTVKNILFISLVVSAILLSFISGSPYYENIKAWNIAIRIVAVAFILVFGTIFPIMITNSISKSFYRKKSNMFEKQLQIQANYYTDLAKSNYELRRFRHDVKNVSIGVRKLINQDRLDEAIEMINTYNENLSKVIDISEFNTGNEIVNALLSDKQKIAATSNTKIVFQGNVPEKFLTPIDLCIVLGNALDNAIEACEQITIKKEKIITLYFTCSVGLAFITITNPVNSNIQIHKNSIMTTKQDKTNHGFGIYSIKKTVKKYNGNLDLLCDNNIFSLNINLELQKN